MAGLLPPPRLKFTDANGVPLVGGKVYTYYAGTARAAVTFTDFTAGTRNANPVILDGNGECDIWFDGLIKVRLEDASGQEIWTRDNLSSIQESITLPLRTSYIGDGAETVYDVSDLNASSVETMLVTVNDLLKEPGIDYTLDTAAGTITFAAAPANLSKIVIRTFGLAKTFNFLARAEVQIATAGQTIFNLANSYAPGTNALQVYINSGRQFPDAYTETDENTVTMAEGLNEGDKVMFVTSEIIGSASKIIDGSVTEQKISAGAVTTSRLADGAVTEPKLANESVSARTLVPGAVGNTALAAGAVTVDKLGGSLTGGIATTGDWSFQFATTPRAGTVWANGGTIGNPASGATNRANNDCYDLFLFLWNNHADAVCPVVGGRGVAAVDDWNANRRITLPDTRDVFFRFWGATAKDPGRVAGTHQLDAQQNITGTFVVATGDGATGAFTRVPFGNGRDSASTGSKITFDASTQIRTALEVRPINFSAGIACLKL